MTSRGLEILSTRDCLDLLRSRTLGHVAVQIGDAPAILPVNYALLDDEVVFRTDPGTKLSAALMRTMVAFEVDDTDLATRSAWSVLVVGYSEQVRDHATLTRVDAESGALGERTSRLRGAHPHEDHHGSATSGRQSQFQSMIRWPAVVTR